MRRSLFALAVAASAVMACGNDEASFQKDPSHAGGSGNTTSTGGHGGGVSTGGANTGGSGEGGASSEVAGFVSGTRLRARYWEGEDGSKQFFGWRDTQLDIDCAYRLATDAQMRCLPAIIVDGGYFADTNCSVAVGLVRKGCAAPPQYVAVATTGAACPTGTKVTAYLAGAAANLVYYWDGGSCTNVTASVLQSFDAYALTAVPASQFVAAQELVE